MTTAGTPPTSSIRRLLVVLGLVLVVAGCGAWWIWGRTEERAHELLQQALTRLLARDFETAERLAEQAWQLNPQLGEAALLVGDCAAKRRQANRAIEWYEKVPQSAKRLRRDALWKAAQLASGDGTYQLSHAEQLMREILEINPQDAEANAAIVGLLSIFGRLPEAVPFVLRQLSLDQSTSNVFLLSRDRAGVKSRGTLDEAFSVTPRDPNIQLGMAWETMLAGRDAESIERLQRLVQSHPKFVRAWEVLGRQLWDASRFDELREWQQKLPPEVDDSAEVWRVRGHLAEQEGHVPGAIRCFGESFRRAPEPIVVALRLTRLLDVADERELAGRFQELVLRMQRLDDAMNRYFHGEGLLPVDDALSLITALEDVGRLWEAYGWCLEALQRHPQNRQLLQRRLDLRAKVRGLPLVKTNPVASPLLTVDWSRFPLPSVSPSVLKNVPTSNSDEPEPSTLAFREDAAAVGLQFRYMNGVDQEPARRMFEFTGGGVGVLDFDVDGFPDAYFTQGSRWPNDLKQTEFLDRLFRNIDGSRFADTTASSGIVESSFGQGVSIGDVDADGFPDVYVANIGGNRLLKNLGDGSFADVTEISGLESTSWTTSCVVADLSGDGLPDVYDVNYVTSRDVFDRVCRRPDGGPALCAPFDFDPQDDRFWLNLGDGTFRDATREVFGAVPEGKGLGALVWSPDVAGRLNLFVTNDTTPNFLFVSEHQPTSGTTAACNQFQERGLASGVALNADGKATGSMGIALGDVDGDGRSDLLITNFYAEPNTLFLNRVSGLFEDRTKPLRLEAPSLNALGFGTQFVDFDLDGTLELFVANGHVDDLSRSGKPYEMHPQVFRMDATRRMFEDVPARSLGPYFEGLWLGRAVARLDWNRDGREDLLVGHLQRDSALLTNMSVTRGGSLAIRLIGVESNRDAVGAIVRATIGGRVFVRHVTAGDGYQASNERRIVIGVGMAERIESLRIEWPSGREQTFDAVSVGESLVLVEGGVLMSCGFSMSSHAAVAVAP